MNPESIETLFRLLPDCCVERTHKGTDLIADLERSIRNLNNELDSIFMLMPTNCVVRVQEGGGPEDIVKSLAVSVSKLSVEYAQARKRPTEPLPQEDGLTFSPVTDAWVYIPLAEFIEAASKGIYTFKEHAAYYAVSGKCSNYGIPPAGYTSSAKYLHPTWATHVCLHKKAPAIRWIPNNKEAGDLMTLKEFQEGVDILMFTDSDGFGYYATDTNMSDVLLNWRAFHNMDEQTHPEWATHVMWFNK